MERTEGKNESPCRGRERLEKEWWEREKCSETSWHRKWDVTWIEGSRMREADTQQEIARGRVWGGKPVVSLMSLHVGQRRQSCLFVYYVTAEQSGGSRTTLMLTGGKEHSSLPEAGCCILSVNLLAHLLTSQSFFVFVFLLTSSPLSWTCQKREAGLTKT